MRTLLLIVFAGLALGADYGAYEPSPAYPHGRPHPEAPAELAQFAFMIGAHSCNDRMRQPDGSWNEFPTRWNARYFMNGFGIQDHYWTPSAFTTTNLRIFDAAAKRWKVTFFAMPNYSSGTWEGKQEGERMVMRQTTELPDGRTRESRLTFYEISAEGFRWKSETITDGGEPVVGWTSDCKKAP